MPTNIRATGVAVGYFVFNALIILHVQTAPLALAALSWRYFLIFLILDCVYVVVVYFFYPETKVSILIMILVDSTSHVLRRTRHSRKLKVSSVTMSPSILPGLNKRSSGREAFLKVSVTRKTLESPIEKWGYEPYEEKYIRRCVLLQISQPTYQSPNFAVVFSCP